MSVERIDTDRLVLVPFTSGMTDAVPEKVRETVESAGFQANGWPPEDTIRILPKVKARLENPEEREGFFPWLFVRREDGKVVGDGGFKNSPGEAGIVEIGYGILEKERRKGYCAEAVSALIDWAFACGGVNAVTADCLTDNRGSAAVLRKCSLHETGTSDGLIHWKREKADFRQKE